MFHKRTIFRTNKYGLTPFTEYIPKKELILYHFRRYEKNINIIIDNKIPFIKGILEPYANVRYLPPSEITKDQVKDTDILIIRTRTRCNENLLSGSRCKFIGTATIGFDHIDTEYCKQNDIEWKNAPGCNASSVGQYILASLLLHGRTKQLFAQREKDRNSRCRSCRSIVAHHCRTIGMTVLLNDPPRANTEQNDTFVSLDTIAEECDFITFHTPLNRTGIYRSFHLADNSFFKKLRKQPVIINSSRGEVVDNKALLTAYQKKEISDIIIDCWENEPDILPELLESSLYSRHLILPATQPTENRMPPGLWFGKYPEYSGSRSTPQK